MCVYRSVMSRVFMREIVCVCASVCNVSSVYERDSVCVHRSVMSSSVYERDSVVCASVCNV